MIYLPGKLKTRFRKGINIITVYLSNFITERPKQFFCTVYNNLYKYILFICRSYLSICCSDSSKKITFTLFTNCAIQYTNECNEIKINITWVSNVGCD